MLSVCGAGGRYSTKGTSSFMGSWWRLRQWVYARPPVVGMIVVVLLSLVGVSGWASARWVTDEEAGQKTAVVVKRTTLAKTVYLAEKAGRAGRRSPAPSQLAEASDRAQTVVVTERVPRPVYVVRGVTHVVTTRGAPLTVTSVLRRTVFDNRTVTRVATNNVTVTRVQTQPVQRVATKSVTVTRIESQLAQAVATNTVTVTRVQTQPVQRVATKTVTQAFATNTVTVTRVQTQPAQSVVSTVTTPPGHANSNGRETQTVTVTVATGTVTVTVTRGH
jgi:hypothetical protein